MNDVIKELKHNLLTEIGINFKRALGKTIHAKYKIKALDMEWVKIFYKDEKCLVIGHPTITEHDGYLEYSVKIKDVK